MKLDYRNSAEIIANTPEAYEKLILDCLNGAMVPNFTHWHEVAQSWKIVDQIRQAWDADTTSPIPDLCGWNDGTR